MDLIPNYNPLGSLADSEKKKFESALELKMKNAAIEHQLRLQQSIANQKFETQERVSQGGISLGQALMDKVGLKGVFAADNQEEYKTQMASLQQMFSQKSKNAVVSNNPVHDPISGLKMGLDKINAEGAVIGRIPDPGYRQNYDRYKTLVGSSERVNELKSFYDDISPLLTGPVGGTLGNALGAVGLSQANVKMNKALKEAGPLIAQAISKVPGGRYSQSMQKQMKEGLIDPKTQKGVVKDMIPNVLFQHYLELKSMGANVPEYMQQMFASIPEGENGLPNNGAFINGQFVTAETIHELQKKGSKNDPNNPLGLKRRK